MNKCPNCGNKLSDIDVLCPKCGTFVEVVQSSGGSTAPADKPASDDGNPSSATDEPRPEIILYNEDLPPDGMPDDDDIDIPETFTQIFHEPEDDTRYADDDVVQNDNMPQLNEDVPADGMPEVDEIDFPENFTQIFHEPADDTRYDDDTTPIGDSPQPDENLLQSEDAVQNDEGLLPEADTNLDDTALALPDENAPASDASFDESVYSESYLDMLKNMALPEVDDLSDFDPDEFMRTYKDTKDTTSLDDVPSDDTAQDSNSKRWLELEDVDPLPSDSFTETDVISDETDILMSYAESSALAEETADEMQSEDTDETVDMTDIYALSANNDSDLKRSDFFKQGARQKPRRKLISFLIVLVWVVLAAVFLFGFIVFDHYVTDTYGSYSNMVDELSNGRIIIDTTTSYQRNATVTITQSQTEDGQSAHLFHVDAPAGQTITLLPLNETFPLTDGKADLIVADDLLFLSLGVHTEEVTYSTDAVSLLVQTYKEPYSFSAETLTLQLEPTHYVRSQPTQSFLSTTDSSISISMTVAPQTTIKINDADHTDGRWHGRRTDVES